MSLALVREALEFVDQEEIKSNKRGKNRRETRQPRIIKDNQSIFSKRPHKKKAELKNTKEQDIEDKVKKLLALSETIVDKKIAEQITERARKGKPVADKIEVKSSKKEKSILFPEETFEEFENQYFCS